MSGSDPYGFSLTTFSKDGTLSQINYAFEAVKKGECGIGIRAKNGVVLVGEKKQTSILVESESVNKVSKVFKHIGLV